MLLEDLDTLFEFIAAEPGRHARNSDFYRFVDKVAKHAFREAQPEFEAGRPVPLGEPINLKAQNVKWERMMPELG
jgi:hypothetical protein